MFVVIVTNKEKTMHLPLVSPSMIGNRLKGDDYGFKESNENL